MKIREKNDETGLIYQIEDQFEGSSVPVVIDIIYSGGEEYWDIEFEHCSVEDYDNPTLTEEQICEYNKILECGREEEYARELAKIYEGTDIVFTTEYKIK
jgi:hypothetical protein